MAIRTNSGDSAALWIDIENVLNLMLRDDDKRFDTKQFDIKRFDIKLVIDKIEKEYGRLIYKKSIGDHLRPIDKIMDESGLFKSYRDKIYDFYWLCTHLNTENKVSIEQVPYRGTKNVADASIMGDFHTVLDNMPHIRFFFIMANDGEYSTMNQMLEGKDKILAVISPTGIVTPRIQNAVRSQYILHYPSIFEEAKANCPEQSKSSDHQPVAEKRPYQPSYVPPVAGSISPDVKKLRNEQIQLIVRICEDNAKKGEPKIAGSQLLLKARGERQGFNYKDAKYPGFLELLKDVEAQDPRIIVHEATSESGDIKIEFVPGAIEKKPLPQEAPQTPSPADSLPAPDTSENNLQSQEASREFTPPRIIRLPSSGDEAPKEESTELPKSSESKQAAKQKKLDSLPGGLSALQNVDVAQDKSSPAPSGADSTPSPGTNKNAPLLTQQQQGVQICKDFLEQGLLFARIGSPVLRDWVYDALLEVDFKSRRQVPLPSLTKELQGRILAKAQQQDTPLPDDEERLSSIVHSMMMTLFIAKAFRPFRNDPKPDDNNDPQPDDNRALVSPTRAAFNRFIAAGIKTDNPELAFLRCNTLGLLKHDIMPALDGEILARLFFGEEWEKNLIICGHALRMAKRDLIEWRKNQRKNQQENNHEQ